MREPAILVGDQAVLMPIHLGTLEQHLQVAAGGAVWRACDLLHHEFRTPYLDDRTLLRIWFALASTTPALATSAVLHDKHDRAALAEIRSFLDTRLGPRIERLWEQARRHGTPEPSADAVRPTVRAAVEAAAGGGDMALLKLLDLLETQLRGLAESPGKRLSRVERAALWVPLVFAAPDVAFRAVAVTVPTADQAAREVARRMTALCPKLYSGLTAPASLYPLCDDLLAIWSDLKAAVLAG